MAFYKPSLASVFFLAGLALANPSAPSGGFSIIQVQKGVAPKVGALDMLKTYRKYGARAPENVLAAASDAENAFMDFGFVPATAEGSSDPVFLSPIKIGSDTLNVDIDTGSADLWVFSIMLPLMMINDHNTYNPFTSGIYKGGETWNVTYGDASGASGLVFADTVVAGEVTATSQAVGAATSLSKAFVRDSTVDGVMGLAFSKLSSVVPHAQTTFFDTMKHTLPHPLFTACLRKGAPGQYDFGYLNSSLYTGDIHYAPIDPATGFWGVSSTGYRVGSGPVVSSPFKAIADTGTSLLYLPSQIVKDYYSKVDGAKYSPNVGGWTVPCDATMPALATAIGNALVTVPGDYFIYSAVDGTRCFGGMQSDEGIGFSILGGIFLKSQFVVFDASTDPPQIGFARQIGVDYPSS
ncbi:uncharacterized protein K452DRAFT_350011 [Aplosporella prunicola CBS 121167]|uniref:Peptidase A1 domain-containing protein n=1 Tax=Aplosporella prunicola CBS 121167 TaxID=1176127 RepID=A0A6A6BJH8_9PEZI|nr:uncharacterized protein K452DRAFT_350011 [Aplosporella prunicola CBS 121167]KAF2144320.1 hypothetical protein K452DRAFT_350011 [Aplosporella prunicola CBS 121167]